MVDARKWHAAGRRGRTLLAALSLSAIQPSCSSTPPSAPESVPRGGLETCSEAALALQVLGSGGPMPDDARASSGYLLWVEGKARALIDAGGGVFQRFGAAAATIDDLDVIAISHLHADHSADLLALLKGGYFSERSRPLTLVGPTGGARFPSFEQFLRLQLDPETGAYRYLSGYVTGAAGWIPLKLLEADASFDARTQVVEGARLKVDALGVEHGDVPALAFSLEAREKKVVFAGDQSGRTEGFADFARGADLLVVHHAVPEGVDAELARLHAPPSLIGKIAQRAEAKRLILSHHMARSLQRSDEALAEIRKSYAGQTTLARDLDCFPFDDGAM